MSLFWTTKTREALSNKEKIENLTQSIENLKNILEDAKENLLPRIHKWLGK